MDQSMQAIGFRRYGPEEVLELLTVPPPRMGSDTVLIRVIAAGVNPADWRFRSGQLRRIIRLPLPFIPGADVSGIVESVGAGVTRFRPGQAVYAMLPTQAGGGYAEYAAVAEGSAALMPGSLTFSEAAGIPLAALTALQALRDKAELHRGMRLLIYGASGGVGTFAIQIAKALGGHVTAVCSGRNADLAWSLGSDAVVDYTQHDVARGTMRFDIIFDVVNKLSFRRVRHLLQPGGTFVTLNPLTGMLSPGWLAYLRGGRRVKSVLVQPSGAGLELLSQWVAAGQIRPVIDRAYPLAEAAAAQRYSATQRARGKIVLLVDERRAAERRTLTAEP